MSLDCHSVSVAKDDEEAVHTLGNNEDHRFSAFMASHEKGAKREHTSASFIFLSFLFEEERAEISHLGIMGRFPEDRRAA